MVGSKNMGRQSLPTGVAVVAYYGAAMAAYYGAAVFADNRIHILEYIKRKPFNFL